MKAYTVRDKDGYGFATVVFAESRNAATDKNYVSRYKDDVSSHVFYSVTLAGREYLQTLTGCRIFEPDR